MNTHKMELSACKGRKIIYRFTTALIFPQQVRTDRRGHLASDHNRYVKELSPYLGTYAIFLSCFKGPVSRDSQPLRFSRICHVWALTNFDFFSDRDSKGKNTRAFCCRMIWIHPRPLVESVGEHIPVVHR
jgi:hypothetical protein